MRCRSGPAMSANGFADRCGAINSVISSEETERISDSKGLRISDLKLLLGSCCSKSFQPSMVNEGSIGDTRVGDTARALRCTWLVLRWYGPKLAESSGASDWVEPEPTEEYDWRCVLKLGKVMVLGRLISGRTGGPLVPESLCLRRRIIFSSTKQANMPDSPTKTERTAITAITRIAKSAGQFEE